LEWSVERERGEERKITVRRNEHQMRSERKEM
jgi:hypothetical protein